MLLSTSNSHSPIAWTLIKLVCIPNILCCIRPLRQRSLCRGVLRSAGNDHWTNVTRTDPHDGATQIIAPAQEFNSYHPQALRSAVQRCVCMCDYSTRISIQSKRCFNLWANVITRARAFSFVFLHHEIDASTSFAVFLLRFSVIAPTIVR